MKEKKVKLEKKRKVENKKRKSEKKRLKKIVNYCCNLQCI
jgi:hypothetical protein